MNALLHIYYSQKRMKIMMIFDKKNCMMIGLTCIYYSIYSRNILQNWMHLPVAHVFCAILHWYKGQ